MNAMTQDAVLGMLDAVRNLAGTNVDHVQIGGGTDKCTLVYYNQNVCDEGAWEFVNQTDTTQIRRIEDIYEASQYVLGIDAQIG